MEQPASIGKYDLEEFLGGGMSHVYRARDRLLGRTVCIKVLTPQGTADPEVRDRFLQEARMAGNFCHDNVVSIYDFGEENGNPFLVMEYLRGDTLRGLMNDGRVGSLVDVLQIGLQLARALECVHGQSIIHRDIKPENVHVNAQGTVKLMDFGIAKARGLNLTQAGFILGTPYYMAPEQIRGDAITPSIDIYAFGVLLYELLAKQKPFQADTPEAIFYAILNQAVDLAPLQQAKVPEPIQTLVARCMNKSAANRPQSFTEIIASLEGHVASLSSATVVHEVPGPVAPTPPAKPPASPVWYLAAALAVMIAAGAVFFVFRPHPPPPLPTTISTPTGEMVLVPAGDFLFGKTREKKHLPAYYIDKTEVSNAAWTAYCRTNNCVAHPGDPDLPVAGISIEEAKSFAKAAGKRIPSSEEWEKAARGDDGRDYPWGNDANRNMVNIETSAPVSVIAHPEGASKYGALQMAGNVSEMVRNPTLPDQQLVDAFARAKVLTPPPTLAEPWITVRGGSFRQKNMNAALTYEFSKIPARFTRDDIGFRCVKDVPP
jgi:formylglycine-generating enzyme required for sulfatase activity